MKGRKWIWIVYVLIFLTSSVSAKVYINEVDLNNGINNLQWIELYNDGEIKNLSGWYLNFKDGRNYSLSEIVIDKFIVIEFTDSLNISGERLILYKNSFGLIEDETIELAEKNGTNKTWSRIPDGIGNFEYRDSTKSLPNQKIEIDNLRVNNSCIIEKDSITVSANVRGFCVEKVLFDFSSNSKNFTVTATKKSKENFEAVIPGYSFIGGENVSWFVKVEDCFLEEAFSEAKNFYVNRATKLNLIPNNPNGKNGWYVSHPRFELANPDATRIFYQWNSAAQRIYSEPFNLSNAPNNAQVTGGLIELNYWSDVCGLESKTRKIMFFDFNPPEIKNVSPREQQELFEQEEYLIEVLIDDKYRRNSGINPESIIFELDNQSLNYTTSNSSGSDFLISGIVRNKLEIGEHKLYFEAEDFAGHKVEKTWFFKIARAPNLSMFVSSPVQEEIYLSRNVPFNITLSKRVIELGFSDTIIENGKFKRLCRDCDEFGNKRKKSVILKDGRHFLSIIAENNEERINKSFNFFVDSKKPRIIGVNPEKGFANGIFSVRFEEANPKNMKFVYGNKTILRQFNLSEEKCFSDSKTERHSCAFYVDLQDFNGGNIFFSFSVEDIANNLEKSKTYEIEVDTDFPIINYINYSEYQSKNKNVNFEIGVTERNFEKITYTDYENNREKTFCKKLINGKCSKTLILEKGNNEVNFNVYDKAGNKVSQRVSVWVN